MPIVLLFTIFILFTDTRAGKAQVKRLEEDARSYRNCRHIYSLLTGTVAVGAADMLYSPPVVDPAGTALEQGLFQVELIYAYRTKVARG